MKNDSEYNFFTAEGGLGINSFIGKLLIKQINPENPVKTR